jgi:uncharacterized lipoprotein YehR (DUF1307 family)
MRRCASGADLFCFRSGGACLRPLSIKRGNFKMKLKRLAIISVAAYVLLTVTACTQEQQNKVQRDIQNWTGTNGVLEIYAGDKLVRRFLKIDKLSTALGTDDNKPRPYRYGYGVLDENFNMVADTNEKRVYFEVSDYASNYVFFENPR